MNSHESDSLSSKKGIFASVTGEQNKFRRRRIGAVILSAGAIAIGGIGVKKVDQVIGNSYSLGSDIPASVTHYNHKLDQLMQFPNTTAWNFVSHKDPGHDPRNGVANLEEQLGHLPQPGEWVVAPKLNSK